jgi:hypothetical protein
MYGGRDEHAACIRRSRSVVLAGLGFVAITIFSALITAVRSWAAPIRVLVCITPRQASDRTSFIPWSDRKNLSQGATHASVRPTQGRTLAVMQVCGGSQSFNVVNALRVLGRWMRMVTIPNQSSVAKAWQEFDEQGRMKPSPFYDRVMDVMEELMKFTLMVRGRSDYLVNHGQHSCSLCSYQCVASTG